MTTDTNAGAPSATEGTQPPSAPPTREPNPAAFAVEQQRPFLKLALELGPIVAFFGANYLGNDFYATRLGALSEFLVERFGRVNDAGEIVDVAIFPATAIFMVAITISIVLSRVLLRTVPKMALVSFVFVLFFGGLTLYLADDTFIKIKPTIVNTFFATVMLITLAMNLLIWKYLLEDGFRLDDDGWRKLQFRWGCFFIFLAILNEVVWRNFSTDFWISFKAWGVMPLTLIFGLAMMPILTRHALPEPGTEEAAKRDAADT